MTARSVWRIVPIVVGLSGIAAGCITVELRDLRDISGSLSNTTTTTSETSNVSATTSTDPEPCECPCPCGEVEPGGGSPAP